MAWTSLDTKRLRELMLMDLQFPKLLNNEHWGEKEELISQSLNAKHRGNERNIAFGKEINSPKDWGKAWELLVKTTGLCTLITLLCL